MFMRRMRERLSQPFGDLASLCQRTRREEDNPELLISPDFTVLKQIRPVAEPFDRSIAAEEYCLDPWFTRNKHFADKVADISSATAPADLAVLGIAQNNVAPYLVHIGVTVIVSVQLMYFDFGHRALVAGIILVFGAECVSRTRDMIVRSFAGVVMP